MNDVILKVENLTRIYRTGTHVVRALDGVSFTLRAGETCAIMGPSGSGKSTLIAICAGLDRPTAGTVELFGQDLFARSEEERAHLRARFIGFVFQTFQLIPTLTALENVMIPAELMEVPDAERRARTMLERVGLADRMDHYPGELSGGEQQRVAIARAFINEPRILFADEPTGNLDGETSQRVFRLLMEINAQHHTTLVLVTHDEAMAGAFERVIHLRKGRIQSGGASGHP